MKPKGPSTLLAALDAAINSRYIEDLPREQQEFLRKAIDGGEMKESDRFPVEVNERVRALRETEDQLIEKVQAVSKVVLPKVDALVKKSMQAKSASAKIVWLRQAADAMLEGYAPISACKRGCNHCCHIPVELGFREALQIGKAIGRDPVAPSKLQRGDYVYSETPCTFLVEGECSIYEHRPLICRTYVNLDEDSLLCRLTESKEIPVPSIDTRDFYITVLSDLEGVTRPADIRDWFPAKQQTQKS